MSVKYGKFEMPTKIVAEEESATPTFARFIAEPFERGFGHTMGNFMRRVLLSSLESPAIVSMRMDGVSHEFMAVDGVIEDMTDIILNLKGALLRKLPTDQINSRTFQEIRANFEVTQAELDKNKGQVTITLGDLIKEGNFEVVNPTLPLFTVTKPVKKQVDFRIGMGRGYVTTERFEILDKHADEILIDASFSPVVMVNYHVEYTRVGQDTDFDKLIVEITTDGRVTPKEALTFASQIGIKHFDVFEQIQEHNLEFDAGEDLDDTDYDEIMEKLILRIDEIELSVRSTNCLSGASIETIAELVSIPERRMLEFRNFGKKSLNEIKAKLHEMGLSLGMDLSKYGLNEENIKEKTAEYLEAKAQDKHIAEV